MEYLFKSNSSFAMINKKKRKPVVALLNMIMNSKYRHLKTNDNKNNSVKKPNGCELNFLYVDAPTKYIACFAFQIKYLSHYTDGLCVSARYSII